MKVSILIPTRNRLAFLRQAIASATAQTHKEIEIVVSDDDSTDGTKKYLAELAASDSRVRIPLRNVNLGIFTNINHLIANSTGEAFCILADDDLLAPEFVERLVEPLLERPDVCATFCDHDIIDAEGRIIPGVAENNSRFYGRADLAPGIVADPIAVAMRGTMCMGFSLYRSSVFQHERFDLACLGAADFDYAIRAARLGLLHFVKQRLGSYRSHANTATGTLNEYMIDGSVAVYTKHRFETVRHEALRRELLRHRLRIKALHASTTVQPRCRDAVRAYIQAGGFVLQPHIVLALILASFPLALAVGIKRSLKRIVTAARRRS